MNAFIQVENRDPPQIFVYLGNYDVKGRIESSSKEKAGMLLLYT